MGVELIPLIQMGIWIIVAMMIGMVTLYFYMMRPSHTNNTYNSNKEKASKENVEYIKKQYVDDGLNDNHDDNGPIQNL